MIVRFYISPELYTSYSEDECPDPSKFAMHTHFQAELFYFLSGDAVYHVEGSEYPLEPGDVLLMRPSEAHYIEIKSPAPYKRVVCNFDPELFSAMDPDRRILRAYTDREAGKGNLYRAGDFKDVRSGDFIRQLYEHRDDRMASIATLMLLLCAINRIFDTAPPAHALSNTVEFSILRYINSHLSENITLDGLAQFFFISRAQLCRRFKKATGTSVGRYITAKRLLAARSMILSGKKPTEVYSQCGFVDYSTFYRAYSKYFGHSPRDEALGNTPAAYELFID